MTSYHTVALSRVSGPFPRGRRASQAPVSPHVRSRLRRKQPGKFFFDGNSTDVFNPGEDRGRYCLRTDFSIKMDRRHLVGRRWKAVPI